jgi:hypothetical protein
MYYKARMRAPYSHVLLFGLLEGQGMYLGTLLSLRRNKKLSSSKKELAEMCKNQENKLLIECHVKV